jgi:uncharacterized protein (DUF1501 family)
VANWLLLKLARQFGRLNASTWLDGFLLVFPAASDCLMNASLLNRRSLLRVGAMALGGLTFTDLLRAEARAGVVGSRKAIINIHLDGGPPHMDMIDPKPLAPVEIRGEFQPIATSVSGIHISELMPQVAKAAKQFVFIRSLVGAASAHDAFQCQSGFDSKSLDTMGGRPALGCVVNKLQGSPQDVAPPFVDLMQGRPLVRNSARPGFLGAAYQPFRPDISHLFQRTLEPGMVKELERRGANHTASLAISEGLTLHRLSDRTSLLAKLDHTQRTLDRSGMMHAFDAFQQQALSMLTSGRFAEAMNLAAENPQVLANYTAGEMASLATDSTSEGANATLKFLLCRRLIQAGVRCVSVSLSDFDTHSDNFPRMRRLVPILDHGLAALVADLEAHDMLRDVMIVVWGEFGRTPTVNAKSGGRDHWPQVGMCMLAGGPLRTGLVLGSTDRTAGSAKERPVHYQDVFATLYHHLGIETTTALSDPSGRPQHLLDRGQILRELL